MKKTIRYSLYGFVIGAGVTLLASFLMFVSLGVVGLSTPMVAVIAGIMCSLGGGWGYRVSLNGTCNGSMDSEGLQVRLEKLWLMPAVAFSYGALALSALYFLVVERSFYFGLAAMFVTVSILLYMTYMNTPQQGLRKLLRGYVLLGFGTTIGFGMLTWNLWSLMAGTVFTVACVMLSSQKPEGRVVLDTLRPKEVQLKSYLNATPEILSETESPQSVGTVCSTTSIFSNRCLLWSIMVVLLGCAILGYFIFPWTNSTVWKGIVGALLIGGSAFILGVITGRCGKSRNSHVQN